ncbi:hypothetical protein [Butyricicoccus sp. Marseille-Q5471]|uniref:hypothetical protein n=1 Tax=Butyricicoccus sp. Marseille-Q5471 TaxID=3039493 RepID=UPI0024BC462F|nr:hypothetical protein [Butyricicoccus sp. Marseille-Q5471]
MFRNWKERLNALRDNRGSGIVTVLVCMLFVSILGATLLYMSYTGFLMKVTERQGKETFYDAASAMTEIQAGVQQVVTESIAAAYQDALVNYSHYYATTDMTTQFQEQFRKAVWSWKNAGGSALFAPVGGGIYTYNPNVLSTFLTAPADATVDTSGVRDARYSGGVITLKNVSVSCSHNDLTETVTSDIIIRMPDFYYLFSEYSISGLPQFAVIAKESLEQTIGNSTLDITGSAYAGRIDLSTAGNSLTIQGGTLICGGNVAIRDAGPRNGYRFTVADNANLWANRIVLDSTGTLNLQGTAYVADDLTLDGTQSSVYLNGSYYGFGSSLTDATKSSAILINGRDTTLDLSHAKRLMLAGNSFVTGSVSPSVVNGSVLMGESVSVKSNQQAYLIPVSELEGVARNPLPLGTSEPAPTVTLRSGSALRAYGVTPQPVILSVNGAHQKIYYYFMKFPTVEDANRHFKDYFTQNQAQLTEYLEMYTTLSTALGSTQTSGYTLVKNADTDAYALREYVPADSLTTTASQLSKMYGQLCVTLSANNSTTTATNPYDYLVKGTALADLAEGKTWFYQDKNGVFQPVALIVRGDYTINSDTPDTVRVILATGNVTVHRDFSGLIISGNTITMTGSVNAVVSNEEEVIGAFTGLNEAGQQFSDFLNVGVTEGGNTVGGGSSNWSLDSLVAFRNWSKN